MSLGRVSEQVNDSKGTPAVVGWRVETSIRNGSYRRWGSGGRFGLCLTASSPYKRVQSGDRLQAQHLGRQAVTLLRA
jgi:hypothetical protein